MASHPRLDVITIGRSSVDLYGAQVGGRLEDMASFSKAVGGCPTNIAIGTARLGLKSGLITRVGDEHMGRFIREQCAREGVDVTGVKTDPVRLTALVLLGIRDEKSFPLIFYRDNCADSALDEGDIDPHYIESAKAVLVSGTHFARANTAAAQRKAMRIARAAGRKVVFDIDYRPNLWGLAGHGAGEERYIKSGEVTKSLSNILPQCDLIVGTEEEMMIAGGADEPLAALKAGARGKPSDAGAQARPDGLRPSSRTPSPIRSSKASRDRAFRWKSITCSAPATPSCPASCAAGCATRRSRPAAPSQTPTGLSPSRASCARPNIRPGPSSAASSSTARPIGRCVAMRRSTTSIGRRHAEPKRRQSWRSPSTIARSLRKIADAAGSARERISAFKLLAVEAAAKVAAGHPGYGMLLDGKYGREALFRAVDHHGFWIGRPVEEPGSRPLEFESGGSLGAKLVEWPVRAYDQVPVLLSP